MKMKEESEKAGLKLNIQKTKIMASSPITWWQIDGDKMETVINFIFLGSKIKSLRFREVTTAMKLKDTCPPCKKSNDKPRQCIKKQRHYFTDKGSYSQSYVFPVVMNRCEIWTINKAECLRTDAFELWCWRRLLRVP